MQRLDYRDSDFAARLTALAERTAFPEDVERSVAAMLAAIRERGDAAIVEYARQYDKVELTPAEFRVSEEEIEAGAAKVSPEIKAALELAHANVTAFARERVPKAWEFSPRPGVSVGERFVPLQRVAAYIPAGMAPLVSTIIHTMTMAQVAGVPEICMLTSVGPSKQVMPEMLYAAKLAGATEIYRLGGVYGVGGLAYGTATLKRVEKIVGPGNAYVTAAKRLVYGHVALDLVAGPSEVLIIADETANPAWVAADLLSQAEHGTGHEKAYVVSTSADVLAAVEAEVARQKALLPKEECVERVLQQGTFLTLVGDLAQAVEVANALAPEHLEVQTANPRETAAGLNSAGAIFLGGLTPEPIGDFVAGPSHVLPTGGAAKFFSGLTIETFFRRMSTIEYDRQALARERAAAEQFGAVEQLAAHGRSVSIRFE